MVQIVFVFFASFVAYATGAVLCKRAFSSRPSAAIHPLESLLVACLLFLIGLLRPTRYSLKYVAACAFAMLIIGAILARITLFEEGRVTAGTREFESVSGETGPRSLWKRWLNFSHAIVDYEFRLLLVAIYLFVIGPFAIIFRLARGRSSASNSSSWTPRKDAPSLASARRPF